MDTALYLLPVTLGDTPVEKVLPSYNREIILQIRHFIVEDVRSARRFLKKGGSGYQYRRTDVLSVEQTYVTRSYLGLSETVAGRKFYGSNLGSRLSGRCRSGSRRCSYRTAQESEGGSFGRDRRLLSCRSWVGIQRTKFAFHGYLPIEPGERQKRLKELEQRVYSEHQTQLFIETPYRNNKMLEDILKACRPQTKLCVAANITCEGEIYQNQDSSGMERSFARPFKDTVHTF